MSSPLISTPAKLADEWELAPFDFSMTIYRQHLVAVIMMGVELLQLNNDDGSFSFLPTREELESWTAPELWRAYCYLEEEAFLRALDWSSIDSLVQPLC